MRHTALAVLLCFSTSVLLFSQKGASSSSTTDVSRNTPSYSPPPSPSSHQSAPSYTPPASSGGGASHSSNSATSSNSAGSSRANSASHLPESNLKTSSSGSEKISSTRVSVPGELSLTRTATHVQTLRMTGSGTSSVTPLIPYSGNDFSKALKSGQLNPVLLEVGLEPNKQAFEKSVAPIDKSAGTQVKNPNWFSRTFLGKQKNQPQTQLATLPRPCPVKGCAPPPPKPCVGKNCKQPPSSGICPSGAPNGAGGCRPWGYLGRCHRDGVCTAQFAPVDTRYCDAILSRIRQLQGLARSQGVSCAANSQGPECVFLKNTNAQIAQLMQQYRMCTVAAGVDGTPYSSMITGPSWP